MGKRKRTKRSFPRKFASDYLNVLSGIDPVRTAAYEIFQNRARVETTSGRRNNISFLKDNTFMAKIPPTITEVSASVWANSPRTAVRNAIDKHNATRKVAVWQGIRHQSFNEYIQGPLLSDWKGITVYLWFSGNNYVLVQAGDSFEATSVVYVGREAAMRAWQLDRVVWSEVEEFKSVE